MTDHEQELLRNHLDYTRQVLGSRQLRSDLTTEEQKAEALRIGRIEFKSAGATRKR